ncbi:MAG: prolyl oligopeptidase family serine peptidase [Flavobacteriaceae bacterium]|nr:MAG: prolyl oligopeptidase family serine peptidase [Flavobacteriaceae bacterium]
MNLINSQVDTLIIHGNKDSYVSYNASKKISEASQRIKLITVENSDHGFDSQENEDYAINCTIEWLKKKER